MKKFSVFLLSLLLIISFAACAPQAAPPKDPSSEQPSVPTEPQEPQEPSNPTGPQEPQEPSNPTGPQEPQEPSNPTGPQEPQESEKDKITYGSVKQKFEKAAGARIILTGRANASVKLGIYYFDSDLGYWQRSELSEVFDATGALTVEFPLPEGANEIEVRILSCLIYEEAAKAEVKAEATIEQILFLDPPAKKPLISPPVRELHYTMPSVGNVRALAIFAEFPDRKFESPLPKEEIKESLFGDGSAYSGDFPYESLPAWFSRASYGNLSLSGDVFFYECKNAAASYLGENHEKLIMEILQGLDGEIDMTRYDLDGNGAPDQLTFAIPVNGDAALAAFWYNATFTWYEHPSFRVDGERIDQYVALDISPSAQNLCYLKSSLVHEIGHCMGLPDYYKYNGAADWEGFHGNAGYTCLDDAVGDFCAFSKLMYGWFCEDEIAIYSGSGEKSFTLYSLSERASCLILPIHAQTSYFSEYFIVEYVTPTQNNSVLNAYAGGGSGVRVFHVQAETARMEWGMTDFKYNNYSQFYQGDDKIRLIRLVNDGRGFYKPGDVCAFGTENFAGYDKNGGQTIDTGYTLRIGAVSGKTQTVTVSR